MSGEYLDSEFYTESSYTADISNKMRVPDRLYAHNGHGEAHNGHREDRDDSARWKEQEQYSVSHMHVPDRILIGGGNEHFSSKATPRELQLEKSIIPPTPEHVRVTTPPRSIKLDEVQFPSAGETPVSQSPPSFPKPSFRTKTTFKAERSMSYDQDPSFNLMTPTADSNLSLYDEAKVELSPELQVLKMRTQMAKLNHRLMALELENQSQSTRWQMLSVVVSAYFIVKTFVWLNRY